MDAIKSWAMTICFAAIAAGIAGIMAPSGNLEKVYKFVVSLFFLACVLVPAFALRNMKMPVLNLVSYTSSTASYSMQDTVNVQVADQTKIKISGLICGCCKAYDVVPMFVYVNVYSDKDGNVKIDSCKAVLKQEDMAKKNELTDAVKKQLGLDVQFVEQQQTVASN
jgi:glucan phosphoethanolaminetransferase (alkaline phosphatase superfamily)